MMRHPRRWLHIYVSMLSFAALLFFAVTGITLNHPTWLGGSATAVRDLTGQLPQELLGAEPFSEQDVAEHLRAEHRFSGRVTEFEWDDVECMVIFKGPGYSADIFIDMQSGKYTAMESRASITAVMNDLHKGRDSGAGWAIVIDVSAVVMIVMSVSGFGLLFYLKKRRVAGVLTAVVGTVLLIVAWIVLVQ